MPSRGASPTPSCQAKFIPTKCKSSDEVLSIYSFYKNTKDIGKLAIALAKYTYFGPQEMSQCTVMGQGNTKPLDPNKLKRLRENIRSVFPMVDDDEFKAIWDKCKESIAGACKALQASIRYLWVGGPPHTTLDISTVYLWVWVPPCTTSYISFVLDTCELGSTTNDLKTLVFVTWYVC